MNALRASASKDFVARTCRHLKSRFPAKTEDRHVDDLRNVVEQAIERGKTHDVRSEYDVTRLSECLLLYGLDFAQSEQTAWALRILKHEDLSGRDKMTAIANYEVFELRQQS